MWLVAKSSRIDTGGSDNDGDTSDTDIRDTIDMLDDLRSTSITNSLRILKTEPMEDGSTQQNINPPRPKRTYIRRTNKGGFKN